MKIIQLIRKKVKFITFFISRFVTRYFTVLLQRKSKHFQNSSSKVSLPARLKDFIHQPLGLAILVILSLVLLVVLWPKFYRPTILSEGIAGMYTNRNLPSIVTNLISQPLIVLDKSGKPQPQLVSGWQVNNDATVYTFKLKDNLFWDDGTKVKSSDIKFNLRDVAASYPNDSTIEFKLADSFNPFPTLLTMPVFKGDSLIGIGKYQVLKTEMNRGVITKLTLKPGTGDLPLLIIRFYGDEKTARTAFELGEVASLIGFNEAGDLKGQPSVNIKKSANYNKLVTIFYNTKDPILSEKNFRKALSFATPRVDTEEIARTSMPDQSWAFNDQLKEQVGDMQLAKTYLGKVNAGKDSIITLTVTPALSSLGEKIIQSWKQIGISAVLRVESGIPQNFQALLISQSIPTDPDQYALWHSTQTNTNLSKYDSKRADKDLEDGRKMSKVDARREKYVDFQKVLADDTPATFLYFPKTNVIYRKKVESLLNKVLDLQLN